MAWRRRWRSCARPNRSAGTRVVTEEMTRYYARRAAEYERVYEIPAWQPALAELRRRVPAFFVGRSEEHTSELQSRPHLVCRLLLEKKKWPMWPGRTLSWPGTASWSPANSMARKPL